MISQFGMTIGAMLLLVAVIVAWQFRSAAAPLWTKISASFLLVILGIYSPFAANSIAGLPVMTSLGGMPSCFELVGILARDDEGKVDLWAIYKGGVPRSYEVELTKGLKRGLRDIADSLAQNGTVHVCSNGQQGEGGKPVNPYGVVNESSADGGIFIDPSFMLNANKVGAQ
jgi:hypothetical protein